MARYKYNALNYVAVRGAMVICSYSQDDAMRRRDTCHCSTSLLYVYRVVAKLIRMYFLRPSSVFDS
jgi:hypothetical protein